jgi:cytoskeleton protein RodZ
MKPGERESVAHGQVLRVVIGRADAVSVEVKGKPFDLKPHTQVTVARFEVQP